jgi:hypothetical protein
MNKILNLESNVMFGIFVTIAILKSQLLRQSLGENYSDASKSGCACLGYLGSTTSRIYQGTLNGREDSLQLTSSLRFAVKMEIYSFRMQKQLI